MNKFTLLGIALPPMIVLSTMALTSSCNKKSVEVDKMQTMRTNAVKFPTKPTLTVYEGGKETIDDKKHFDNFYNALKVKNKTVG